MYKNFIHLAIRNIMRGAGFSLLNIFGLALGLAVCITLYFYVSNELGYDKHHEKHDRIYRVQVDANFGNNDFVFAAGPAPAAQALLDDIPQVEVAARFRKKDNAFVKKGEEIIKEEKVVYADQAIMDIFTIPLVSGKRDGLLDAPDLVMISATAAQKYFGEIPTEEQLEIDGKRFKVTGVYKDFPPQSHFHFDLILSMPTLEDSKNPSWLRFFYPTYVLLKEGTSPAEINPLFPALLEKYLGPQIERFLGSTLKELKEKGQSVGYELQALTDIHLRSPARLTRDFEPGGDLNSVYAFGAIGILILVVACINFMNLSTARSLKRAKEVGVRKTLGSLKSHLVIQFMVETFLICLISYGLALLIAWLAIPFFNDAAGSNIDMVMDVNFALASALIILVVSFLSGLYPSFYLSAFDPALILKGSLTRSKSSSSFRSALVVFQFAISVGLILSASVINDQMNYISNKKLGFEKDQVLVLENNGALGSSVEAFKTEVLRNESIKAGSLSGYLPTTSRRGLTAFWPEGVDLKGQGVSTQAWTTDYDYLQTFGIDMKEGRFFSREFPSDSNAVVINETMAKALGHEAPVGKIIKTPATFSNTDGAAQLVDYKVIGVMEDFHFNSLKKSIGNLVFTLGASEELISFKLNTSDLRGTLGSIKSLWLEMAPGAAFSYSFLDERFNEMYENESQLSNIISIFTVLAIIVASLGLFGLSSYTTEQRLKELGIRKILGASTARLIFLLVRQYGQLILISLVIGLPVTYYLMNQWLAGFAYRLDISLVTIFFSAVSMILVAWGVTFSQTFKITRVNLVNVLRDE